MNLLPPKLQTWIDKQVFPQRILLSGPGDNFELALHITAQLQQSSVDTIKNGSHADTLLIPDMGKSFKVSFSDSARQDGQSEHQNARGLAEWAHKKPVAPYRIVILENIERAGITATNALLKIIEEPPLKTLFLITTKNHHKLLDTIISRVTVVRIAPDGERIEIPDDVIAFLEGNNTIERFRQIEMLEKGAKDNPAKKMNRQVLLHFLEDCCQYARGKANLQHQLPLLLETHRAVSQNLSPKFSFERLALKLDN